MIQSALAYAAVALAAAWLGWRTWRALRPAARCGAGCRCGAARDGVTS